MLLMRGSVSPLRTRRSSASEEGRVFVGSSPTRLYIVRTAVTSAGGLMRTAASAAASGAFKRAPRSTTVAPSSHRTPARMIDPRSDDTEKCIAVGAPRRSLREGGSSAHGRRDSSPHTTCNVDLGQNRMSIRRFLWRNDRTHALGKFSRIGSGQICRIDRLVNNQPHAAWIGCEAILQHDVAA